MANIPNPELCRKGRAKEASGKEKRVDGQRAEGQRAEGNWVGAFFCSGTSRLQYCSRINLDGLYYLHLAIIHRGCRFHRRSVDNSTIELIPILVFKEKHWKKKRKMSALQVEDYVYNSIRHNLSLHNKFIKVHNEATGKSSWWMLNPEGGKSGKAPRRRAASMDNNSKLAKLRGKTHRKKPAMAAAPEPTADSPVSQFPKWPGSPSSRSNEDSEVWTSIRPRTSSNASSVGLSSVLAEQDDLADEELLPTLVYSSASSNVPPTVTEELELIDGLNLMSASSSSLLAPQQPAQRNPTFPLRAPGSAAQAQGSFGSSLFSPMDHLLPGSDSHFSQSLEELLTSNSPPASDVMMTQVDPILPQSGSRVSSQSYLLLGDQPSKPKMSLGSLLRKPLEQQLESIGATALPSAFTMAPSSQSAVGLSALKTPGSALPAQVGQLGPPPALSAPFPAFDGNQDKLPNDLDVDMYMEDLQCDVDYIISTDLMDGEGLDFNFEPLPSTPSYPSTSQASNHSWVPS
ncbi:forkhead box protein O4 isoform X2 [Thamnophis elegans]|uniref:forkhead box protein O4 isoform X2 n=1 Tax=Thamnophis elegans TaxID=35005 RepID=UPI0013765CDD|nr:forkhead box protein O4 isoform X2 [Thamnophis elegans]